MKANGIIANLMVMEKIIIQLEDIFKVHFIMDYLMALVAL